MVNSNNIKGFRDFLGSDAVKRNQMMKVIEDTFSTYGFEAAETPIIESAEFVKGENSMDDAVRDVFKLNDRGKRELALRYEFTFQLKRLSKNQKLPFKRYQIGPVFRDEPVREGRLRQFIQCDADIVGSSIQEEAEVLAMTKKVFEKLGIKSTIYINNRKLINEILVSEDIEEKNRGKVIRELDKLDKLSKKEVADKLKKLGAEKLLKIFDGGEKKFEKYKFYSEIKELKKYCKEYGVKVEFRPYLARGLAYYNGSVFEVWSNKLGVSLAGGGSYLVDQVQATGISFGLEPLFLLSTVTGSKTGLQIISIEQDKEAIRISEELRSNNVPVNLVLNKGIKKALDYANSKEVEKVLFVGKEEVKNKKYKLKDMKTGKEEDLGVEDLIKKIKK